MEKKNQLSAGCSRRRFLGTAASASMLPFAAPLMASGAMETPSAAPAGKSAGSRFGGVQIGTITYSFRGINGLEATLKACVDAGVSSVELMGSGVEEFLGAPAFPLKRAPFGPPPGQKLSDEDQAKVDQYKAALKEWRATTGKPELYQKVRKLFNDAGVQIHLYKWTAGNTPEELDYSFRIAKVLGAYGITSELGEENCRIMGPAAERNGMLALFHNHYQYAQPDFDVDKLLSYSPANRLNFDAGHYFGSTGKNPCDFIRQYKDKICSLHLKDKTAPTNATQPNANQVWGQGETPVAEILKLVQQEKLKYNCDIELEYEVKPWSDAVKEVRNCVHFCRQILV
ncbi:MAG: hypothetical protein LWW85_01675 [Marinilabiliales bacterium]|nr:hypothetical protein [Marinilabiliales bacterium]